VNPLYDDGWGQVYQGDCREMLAQLPAESVHCCVTSPPYWGLRQYQGVEDSIWDDGWRGQFGAEPTVELYVTHTIEILRLLKRVLRKDAVLWWNIGDSYIGSCQDWGKKEGEHRCSKSGIDKRRVDMIGIGQPVTAKKQLNMKPLDLALIPSCVALAARADGWYVRSEIIWHKRSPMPESVNGWRWEKHASCLGCSKCSPNDGYILRKGSWRPTRAHEYILMMTKSDTYYCDKEAVKEPEKVEGASKREIARQVKRRPFDKGRKPPDVSDSTGSWRGDGSSYTGGRNQRSVWEFTTANYTGPHFATYPEELPRRCILASTSEHGCCSVCGAPWVRVIEHQNMMISHSSRGEQAGIRILTSGTMLQPATTQTLGWRPSCNCQTESIPCTVLDPFAGTGTSIAVAKSLGRRGIGIEVSEQYCQLATERIRAVSLPMWL